MKRNPVTNLPSLQHFVSLVHPDSPRRTAEAIIERRDSEFGFAVHVHRGDLAKLLKSPEHFDRTINGLLRQTDPKPSTKMLMEILKCGEQFAREYPYKWFAPKPKIMRPFCKGVAIPIDPLGVIGDGQRVDLVWAQVWKQKSLSPYQFNLACSLLKKLVIDGDPDLDGLTWLEMSAGADNQRVLQVRDLSSAYIMTEQEIAAIVDVVEDAMEIVKATPPKPKNRKPKPDPKQPPLPF